MNKFLLISIGLVLFFLTILMYLVILGGNMSKSEEEKLREDKEQIEYLKNYKKSSKWGTKYGKSFYR